MPLNRDCIRAVWSDKKDGVNKRVSEFLIQKDWTVQCCCTDTFTISRALFGHVPKTAKLMVLSLETPKIASQTFCPTNMVIRVIYSRAIKGRYCWTRYTFACTLDLVIIKITLVAQGALCDQTSFSSGLLSAFACLSAENTAIAICSPRNKNHGHRHWIRCSHNLNFLCWYISKSSILR